MSEELKRKRRKEYLDSVGKPVVVLPKRRYKTFIKGLRKRETWAVLMNSENDVREGK